MDQETPASPVVQNSVQSIDKLAEALAKAQAEFQPIPKDSKVDVKSKEGKHLYSYMYADLTTIIDKTRPALNKHGLSFTQGFVRGGVVTTIMHSSGQTLECGFIPCDIPKGADYKQVAGAVTYVKRISLTAALGVSADEDVDAAPIEGNAGNTTTKGPAGKSPPAEKEKPKNAAPAGPTQAMLKRLYAIGKSMGWEPLAIRTYCLTKVKRTPGQLSKPQYDKLCETLEHAPFDEMQAAEIEVMYENLNELDRKRVEGE